MHFALVHGAYHGAWCWDRLRAELERDGHTTSAAELPCEDPDAGAEQYADEVVRAIRTATHELVVVGHSLAGLTIPLVAERTRTLTTIYLCALLPVPGLSFDAQNADMSTGFEPSQPVLGNPDGSASWPEAGAIEAFFHDCDAQTAMDAARRLRRQHWRVTQEVTPLHRRPVGPSAYVLCNGDRMVSAQYSRRAAMDFLGVETLEMNGGHSPFLSRPLELAGVLESIASTAGETAHG